MNKYLNIKKYKNGDVISILINDLYNINKYKNILFIRSPTTGDWLDKLFVNDENITRIMYFTNKTSNYTKPHKSSIIVSSENFSNTIKTLNTKYDLICIDPFHEYYESNRDFTLLGELLSSNGILISHDCFPPTKDMATPKYKNGSWCGETYIAFINFAYNNPNYYYTILNIDTGIGIISKNKFDNILETNLNTTKQEKLLVLHKNFENIYDNFVENSSDLINVKNLNF